MGRLKVYGQIYRLPQNDPNNEISEVAWASELIIDLNFIYAKKLISQHPNKWLHIKTHTPRFKTKSDQQRERWVI